MYKSPKKKQDVSKKATRGPKPILALPPIPESDLGQEPQVLDSFAIVPELGRRPEQVGEAYAKLQGKFSRAEKRAMLADGKKTDKKGKKIVVDDSSDDGKDEESKQGDNSYEDSPEGKIEKDAQDAKYENKRKKKTKEDIEREALLMEDLYGTLGLGDFKFEASDKQIGKAYKKISLIFHPDKLGDKLTEKDKEVWLKIQAAYETLSDPARRKKYDSSLPFDDALPKKDDISEVNFYEKFAACFQNNSRFSQIKPLPNLGDKSTPLDEVNKFYRFWDNFKTWREFGQFDEYDTEDAQDRYEKRWMEKQNKKCREENDRKERKRIIGLVTLAKLCDPRVQAELNRIEAEKVAAKAAAKEAKHKKFQEIADGKRVRQEARQKEIDDVENAKKKELEDHKQNQKAYRETTKALIAFCTEKMPGTNYDRFYIEEMIKKYPKLKDLDEFFNKVVQISAIDKDVFIKEFLTIVDSTQQNVQQESQSQQAEIKEQEIQQKNAKKLKEWSKEEEAQLILAIKKFPTGTQNRWKVIADYLNRNLKETIGKAKEMSEKKQSNVDNKRQQELERREQEEKYSKVAKDKIKKDLEAKRSAKQVEQPAADAWTSDQQNQIEKGMRDVPASVATKERWIKIAESVDGKTAKECFTRFKELCAKAKATQK